MYQLGFVFLELIFASFCDDNAGAEKARGVIGEFYTQDFSFFHMFLVFYTFIAVQYHLFIWSFLLPSYHRNDLEVTKKKYHANIEFQISQNFFQQIKMIIVDN